MKVKPEKRQAFWQWRWNHILEDDRLRYFLERDEWLHPVSDRIRNRLVPYVPVLLNDDDGRLVSPTVERLALEWRSVIAGVPLRPIDVDLLLGSIDLIERPINNGLRSALIYANAIVLAREHFSFRYTPHLRRVLRELIRSEAEAERPARAEAERPSYDERKIELVAEGLLLAVESREAVHRVQFGNRPGRSCRPADEIGWDCYLAWLKNATVQNVVEKLGAEEPQDCREGAGVASGSPLDSLLVADKSRQAQRDLEALRTKVTPAQARLVDALLHALTVTDSWPRAQEIAAENLGIKSSTLRVQLRNMRKRVRAA